MYTLCIFVVHHCNVYFNVFCYELRAKKMIACSSFCIKLLFWHIAKCFCPIYHVEDAKLHLNKLSESITTYMFICLFYLFSFCFFSFGFWVFHPLLPFIYLYLVQRQNCYTSNRTIFWNMAGELSTTTAYILIPFYPLVNVCVWAPILQLDQICFTTNMVTQ